MKVPLSHVHDCIRRWIAACGLILLCLPAMAAELPFTVAWQAMPTAPALDFNQVSRSFALTDGRIWLNLRTSDRSKSQNWIYDGAADTWTRVATSPIISATPNSSSFLWHECPLPGGRVAHIAKHHSGEPATPRKCAIWSPHTDTWTSIRDTPAAGYPHCIIAASDGSGIWFNDSYNEHYHYDESSDTWTKVQTFPPTIIFSSNLYLPNGKTVGYCFGNVAMLDLNPSSPATHPINILLQHWSIDRMSLNGNKIYCTGYDTRAGDDLDKPDRFLHEFDIFTDDDRTLIARAPTDSTPAPICPFTLHSNSGSYSGYLGAEIAQSYKWGGAVSLHILDHRDQTWVDATTYPVTFPEFGSQNKLYTADLADGILTIARDADENWYFHRLRVISTGEPEPARIADELPATLALDEGRSALVPFRLEGEIPAGGVTVVAERIAGDGDIRVLDVVSQTCEWNFERYHISIASLIDVDGEDDRATIRLRVVQAGGGADPNARQIAVTATDLYENDPSHQPGDVNGDGVVNALDLDEVIDHFGTTYRED